MFLFVVLLGAVVIALGVLALGAFPPHVRTQPVQHVIPNDRFAPR